MDLKPRLSARGVCFGVKVTPGSSRNSVVAVEGEVLKIRLSAPPAEGKANKALIELLSRLLSVSKSRVHIRSGFSSKRKMIFIENYDVAQFREFLSHLDS
jgi:uncharacterized protein